MEFDFSKLGSNELLIIVVLILLDRFGLFSGLKKGVIKIYNDVKRSDNQTPKNQSNNGITLARESLDIIRESQKLVLLDIPHKLDEAIDEMHEIQIRVCSLIEIIKVLVEEVRTQNNHNNK